VRVVTGFGRGMAIIRMGRRWGTNNEQDVVVGLEVETGMEGFDELILAVDVGFALEILGEDASLEGVEGSWQCQGIAISVMLVAAGH
jgi:hypothetical protein